MPHFNNMGSHIQFPNLILTTPYAPIGSPYISQTLYKRPPMTPIRSPYTSQTSYKPPPRVPYTFQTSCHEQTRAKRGFLRVQIINEMLKNDYFSVEGKGTLHTYLHFLQIFFTGVKLCVREAGKTLLCSMYPSKKGLFFLMPLAQRMPIFNKKIPWGMSQTFKRF